MKYAQQIIDLMSAYPGRPFRMHEITRYCVPTCPDGRARRSLRRAVLRVLAELQDHGAVVRIERPVNGGFAEYVWGGEPEKARHELEAKRDILRDNPARISPS